MDAETDGRRSMAGFLLQILCSIKLGLDMSLTFTQLGDGSQLILHLEPAEGGDAKVVGGPRDIVEQMKMRKAAGTWDSGEIASEVFPDLLKAVSLGKEQEFRFVTNNDKGLGRLQDYVAARAEGSERRHKWGNSNLTRDAFELRLARSAGLASVTPKLRHLLDRFRIEIIDVDVTQDDIDKRLAAVIPPSVPLAWLGTLAGDASPGVQEAACDAVRRRALEASAMEHRALLMTSPKPPQWARLLAIIELVNPFFLWSRDDPSNLGEVLDSLPFEVLDEADRVRKQQLKQREDAARKADKNH